MCHQPGGAQKSAEERRGEALLENRENIRKLDHGSVHASLLGDD